jgi:hypothetical protein
MSKGLTDSGIEKWAFDTINFTIIYQGKDGSNVLFEEIK